MPGGMLAGTSAYWRDEGDGAREMLLLHCTMAHSGAWKGVMAGLTDICHMYAMDLPAHGRSGGQDISVSWQTQSSRMAVALIEAGKTPVDLVGHSFGATVALRIAVERPELVRCLILIEPVFFSAAKDTGRPEFAAHLKDHHNFYDMLDRGAHAEAARVFSDLWGGQGAWDALPEAQKTYMADRIEMIRQGGNSLLGEGPDYIPLARITAIKQPVLLIDGDLTDPIIGAVQESLMSVLPQAKRVTIKGAGHMVPITHAPIVAGEIRDFLSAD